MTVVPRLSDVATLICAQSLLDLREDTNDDVREFLIGSLKTHAYTSVSSRILSHLVKYYPDRLTDRCFEALVPPHQREIRLPKCTQLTKDCLLRVLQKCSGVHLLDLTECNQLIGAELFAPGPHLDMLTTLIIEECETLTDDAIQSVLRNVPSLRLLNLSSCDKITDYVFLLDQVIQPCRDTARGKQNSAQYLCQLRSVDVSGCGGITSNAIRHLVKLCGPTLQCVDMSSTMVDCTALLYLSGYTTEDEVEEECTRVSMERIEQLPHMRKISVDNGNSVIDNEVMVKSDSFSTNVDKVGDIFDSRKSLIANAGNCEYKRGENDEMEDSKLENFNNNCDTSTDRTSGKETQFSIGQYQHGTVVAANDGCSDQELQCSRSNDANSLDKECDTCTSAKLYLGDLEDHSDESGLFSVEELEYPEIQFEDVSPRQAKKFVKSKTADSGLSIDCSDHLDDGQMYGTLSSDYLPCSSAQQTEPKDYQRNKWEENSVLTFDTFDSFTECDLSSLEASKEEIKSDNATSCTAWPLSAITDPICSTDDCGAMDCSTLLHIDEISIATGLERLDAELNTLAMTVEKFSDHHPIQANNVPLCLHQDISNSMDGPPINGFNLRPANQIYVPRIHSLDVSHINFAGINVENVVQCLHAFFRSNQSLHKLGISWKGLSNEMLCFLLSHCPELREISLVDCESLTYTGIVELGLKCPKLTKLDLKGVCFISDGALVPLLSHKVISHLTLAECDITDSTLSKIAEKIPETVELLDLSWCDDITEGSLDDLLSAPCSQLKSFSLRQGPASDSTVSLIARCCHQLTELVLSSVQGEITDCSVVSLASNLHLLQYIDIGWNLGLTDLSISAFLQLCPRLETAIFAGIKLITSKPFLPLISDLGKWKRSKALIQLKQHERILLQEEDEPQLSSDEECEELYMPHRSTVYAPNLRYMDLIYCDLVTDSHLEEIVAVCRSSLEIQNYYGYKVSPLWKSSGTI